MSTEKEAVKEKREDFKKMVRDAVNNSPYYKHIGMKLIEFKEQGSVMELQLKREHKNIWDTAHGGVLASLLDSACGLSMVPLMEGGETAVTQDLHIKYLAPLKKGLIRAYGRVVHKGKQSIVSEAEAYDEDGQLVGKAYATHRVYQGMKNEGIK